jgi:hypothetical protein
MRNSKMGVGSSILLGCVWKILSEGRFKGCLSEVHDQTDGILTQQDGILTQQGL